MSFLQGYNCSIHTSVVAIVSLLSFPRNLLPYSKTPPNGNCRLRGKPVIETLTYSNTSFWSKEITCDGNAYIYCIPIPPLFIFLHG